MVRKVRETHRQFKERMIDTVIASSVVLNGTMLLYGLDMVVLQVVILSTPQIDLEDIKENPKCYS